MSWMLCKQRCPKSCPWAPSLVVLSPQLSKLTNAGAEAQKLGFPILTDHDNQVGEAYGLAFRLPDDLIEVYKQVGHPLPRYNGDESWRLSMPARIVIRRDGIVAAVETDPDYRNRPEVEPALEVLRRLRTSGP